MNLCQGEEWGRGADISGYSLGRCDFQVHHALPSSSNQIPNEASLQAVPGDDHVLFQHQ